MAHPEKNQFASEASDCYGREHNAPGSRFALYTAARRTDTFFLVCRGDKAPSKGDGMNFNFRNGA